MLNTLNSWKVATFKLDFIEHQQLMHLSIQSLLICLTTYPTNEQNAYPYYIYIQRVCKNELITVQVIRQYLMERYRISTGNFTKQ